MSVPPLYVDDEILPGRPVPPECHAELHTDYDGAAVRWGLTHHKESAADCCQACLDHAKRAQPGDRKCNIWVYCPSETGCHSPDIYEHKHMECWLKYVSTKLISWFLIYFVPHLNLTFFIFKPKCRQKIPNWISRPTIRNLIETHTRLRHWLSLGSLV